MQKSQLSNTLLTNFVHRYFFLGFFYFFASCGIQKRDKKYFDWAALPTAFPPFFSIHAGLSVKQLNQSFCCRIVYSVIYDQAIHFIVKGPLGIEIIHGVVDKKGIKFLNRLHFGLHQWDYNQIKKQYNFDANYLLIQSILLGKAYDPINDNSDLLPDTLSSFVTYAYDKLSNNVTSLQWIDKKRGNQLKFLYQHKIIAGKLYLSGISIFFCLKNKEKSYTGNIRLHRFHFKRLKRPNNSFRRMLYSGYLIKELE